MFRAGQISAARRLRAWPLATAALAILAVSLGAVLALRPAPQPTERIVYVPPKVTERIVYVAPPARSSRVSAAQWRTGVDYIKLRQKVLSEGLDALPAPEPSEVTTELKLPAGFIRMPWRGSDKQSPVEPLLNSGEQI